LIGPGAKVKTSNGIKPLKNILVMIPLAVLVAGRVATAKVRNNSMLFF
jgi:hypothetical protein